jgi:hypothetical protein
MGLEIVARGKGQFWGERAAQLRAGPPEDWRPFDGTLDGAKKRVAHLEKLDANYLDMLARACLQGAREAFEAFRQRSIETRKKAFAGLEARERKRDRH